MVEDNPQDLVHDLAAEAVFGSHPLGRPVIGRAEVIASISRRALHDLSPRAPTSARTSSSRRRATSTTTASSPSSLRGVTATAA